MRADVIGLRRGCDYGTRASHLLVSESLSLKLPFQKEADWIPSFVGINLLRADAAQPDAIGSGLPCLARQRRLIAGSIRAGRGDMGSDARYDDF